jgi:hypothetical protein
MKTWGLVNSVRDDFVQIEGVDLHSGSRLTMDVTTSYLRIYLGPNSCGNTVARLLRNLQAHIYFGHRAAPARSRAARTSIVIAEQRTRV